GPIDIAEFAPKSVKSEGDFEDILAADNPDVWKSNRPAQGGETGAMLATIIERAAALKSGKSPAPSASPSKPREAAASPNATTPKAKANAGSAKKRTTVKR